MVNDYMMMGFIKSVLPVMVEKAMGAIVTDVHGRDYLDCCDFSRRLSLRSNSLDCAIEAVAAALQKVVQPVAVSGACSELVIMARKLEWLPECRIDQRRRTRSLHPVSRTDCVDSLPGQKLLSD